VTARGRATEAANPRPLSPAVSLGPVESVGLTYLKRRGTLHKEIREIVRHIEAEGYAVVPAGKHLKVKNEIGSTLLHAADHSGRWPLEAEPARRPEAQRHPPTVNDYTITLETKPLGFDSAALDAIAEIIYEDKNLIAPALGIKNEALTATFTVNAADLQAATHLALFAFMVDLRDAGWTDVLIMPDEVIARFSIEPEVAVDEHVTA
jgi:hypothetical protein